MEDGPKQRSVGGESVAGAVEMPAKLGTGRKSQSESNGTERLGGSPVGRG
jgi:hypothetical protein